MKTNTSFRMKNWIALAALAVLGSASNLNAAPFSFDVDVNTTVLNPANGPYYLDFYLGYGGLSTLSNIATISHFTFTGTGAGSLGSPIVYSGDATGDFGTGFTLDTNTSDAQDGSSAEIYQAFTPGTTDVKFTVTLTQNTTNVQPDIFEVFVDDNTQLPIETTAPDGAGLIEVGIPSLQAYPSVPLSSDSVEVYSIVTAPEPSTWALSLFSFVAGGFWIARSRARRA